MNKPHVLIVDDEPAICDLIFEDLNELGYICEIAMDSDSALQKISNREFDLALLDIRLLGISGIELLKEIMSQRNSAVVMITALNDVKTAIECMKLGASDYLIKPFSLNILNSSVEAALEKRAKLLEANTSQVIDANKEGKELQEIEAIANGIMAKLDMSDRRSETVVIKTIEAARGLNIPEDKIMEWVAKKAKSNKQILKLLKKFNQNAIAQIEMGMTTEYRHEDDSYKSNN